MAIAPMPDKLPANASVAVWALTPNGKLLGEKLCCHLKQARLFISSRLDKDVHIPTAAAEPGTGSICKNTPLCDNLLIFQKLSEAVSEQFHAYDCHVFIFSTGIAVRILAPLLVSKLTDPAVVVLDDHGLHAISLISGHIGQANNYTRHIARLLKADPVITTATDVNDLPAIDLLAENLGMFIETPDVIKIINMAFLAHCKIRLQDPLHLLSPWIPRDLIDHTSHQGPTVVCDWKTRKVSRETLVLRPRVLAVGIGCNRNTPFEMIHNFFTTTMETAGISVHAVAALATTDLKQDEAGILALAAHINIPVRFYDKTALSSVKTIQTPSRMVEKHVGVKSVCEAAAILASNNGTLILPKKKNQDITLAVALHKTGSLL
jgi:cobalt-precorrin 5A hydrolase